MYRLKDGRFTRCEEQLFPSSLPNVYTTLATTDGSIWAAGESFVLRSSPGQAVQLYRDAPIRGEAIRAMCADDQAVWLGTYYSTLLRVDAAGVTVVLTNGTLGGDIRSLAREKPGTLWIGTAAGLYRWRDGQLRAWTTRDGLLSASIQALACEPDGTLWIGTLGGGLARMKDGQIFNITSQQGLEDNVVSQILLDEFGNLWLGSNHGIMRLERAEVEALIEGRTSFLHASLLKQDDGIFEEQCANGHSPTAIKTSAGRMLFPTSAGIVEIDPRRWLEHPGR